MPENYLPVLAPIPNISQEPLTLKCTTSGVTWLKDGTFRKRYTGNKYSAVDINGNLWLKNTELQKEIKGDRISRFGVTSKKKSQVETQDVFKNKFITVENYDQMYDNLSTQYANLLTANAKLSPQNKSYTINKREVRQRLLGYINTYHGKKELYFWTVSFPEGIPDQVAYKVYNIWLTALRQRGLLRQYLWIAERQENGTIHFHIAIPHKMPVQRANSMMKGTLKTFIKRGEINYSLHKIARYNGVDIAKNRTTKRVTNFAIKKGSRALVTYLTKYITKNNTAFSHLAWHNSRGYSSIFTGVTFNIPEFKKLNWPELTDKTKARETEYFVFIPWKDGPPFLLTDHLYKLNSCLQLSQN